MPFLNRVDRYVALAVFFLALILAGCSDDDGPTTPEEKEKGTIIIDQTPNALTGAGWTLTGPEDQNGSGDITLRHMQTGSYTLAWDAVSGYNTPPGDTKTLVDNGTITFSGLYVGGSTGEFVLIPAGTFLMGTFGAEPNTSDEIQHTVTLTTPFYMLTTEVTNLQYAEMAQWTFDNGYCTTTSASISDNLDGSTVELLDLDGSYCEISFSGGIFTVDAGKENHPVIEVTWYGAVAYCDWLSLKNGLPRAYDHSTWQCNGHAPYSAQGYRLPTEAEWEYACRAGTQTSFNTGTCLDAGTESNYDGNYPYTDCPTGPYVEWTVPVGSYPANAWGLYDMHGNVAEVCNDWYGDYTGDETDPVGPTTGTERVTRGGSWDYAALGCRSANRNYSGVGPSYSGDNCGFRPVISAE